jgi:hypothetical protein
MSDAATRRGFMSGFVSFAGGVAALSACSAPGGGARGEGAYGPTYERPLAAAPPEIVAAPPGATYENVLPSHVPFVRWPGVSAPFESATFGPKE